MRITFLLLITTLLFYVNDIHAKVAKPAIIWASSPVQPDETVLIRGGNFSQDAEIELVRLEDADAGIPNPNFPKISKWTKAEILKRGKGTLMCLVPADWTPGIYACRIQDSGSASDPVFLNAPDTWWCQSDYGGKATPGGWLRLVGRCMNINIEGQNDKKATVYLRDDHGQLLPLPLQWANAFDLQVHIPLQATPGNYEVWVHNGFGGSATWTNGGKVTIANHETWPSEVFNVKELGWKSALERAKTNGGGVIYFPAGEYEMTDSLEIPDHTVLRGERTDLTSIYWKDLDSIPKTLIHGHNFAVEDLSFYCQNMYYTFLRVDDGEFRMDHVRIRTNYMYKLGRTAHETPFRGRQLNGKIDKIDATIHLEKVKYFKVTNCDILAGSLGFKLWFVSNGLIKNTRLQYGRNGIGCESTNQIIVENCLIEGIDLAATGNFFATYFGNSGENFLVKGNQFKNAYGLDQELFTFDAAAGAYLGKVAATKGTHLTLASDPVFKRYAPNATDWRNTVVCIMDGAGMGQYRRVAKHEGRDWELDKPWLIEPDESSIISIIPFRGSTLFVDNSFEDGGSLQLYGISINNIFAGNKGTRMNGFFDWGKESKGWGWQPSWYNQFMNNEIVEGNNYGHSPATIGIRGTVSEEANRELYSGPLNSCVVLRGNTIRSNGMIRIEGLSSDVIVEKNSISYSQTGVRVEKQPWNILLRKNHFEKVENPYFGDGIEKATIIPEK